MKFPRICVFGDSIAWGSFDYERGGWVNRLQATFMERERDTKQDDFVTVFNCAIPGERVADVLLRFDTEIEPRKSFDDDTIAIVAIGINDSRHTDSPETPLGTFEQSFRELLACVKHNVGINGLIVEPTNVIEHGSGFSNATIEPYVVMIRELCAQAELSLVPMFGKLQASHFDVDCLHLSPAGHEFVASEVLGYLDKIIAR